MCGSCLSKKDTLITVLFLETRELGLRESETQVGSRCGITKYFSCVNSVVPEKRKWSAVLSFDSNINY
jgi:hypothetical protein